MSQEAGARGWRRAAGIAFVVLAFLFLGAIIARNVGELRAQQWTVRPVLLVLSVTMHIGALFWGVAVWKLLLRVAGYDLPVRALARVWFVSALGKYIPGKVWQFVGAAHIGRSTGLPAAVTVTALAAHMYYFLVAALLISVYLVPWGLGVHGVALAAMHWTAPLLLLLVHPAPLAAFLRLARRASGRELGAWSGSWGDAIRIVLLAMIGWALTGISLFVFLLSLTPLPLAALPAVVGMNALSFVVGTLFFIAPAGLGAKEGALAVLLATYMTAPAAALLAIAARLWTVAAEVIPALLLLRTGAPADGGSTPAEPLHATAKGRIP